MALKLDMSKAYDRVEWAFLESILVRLGFTPGFVALMMQCVSYVSYSVLINGVPSPRFFPSRGLHQGDPISPYLFILMLEALSCMINNAVGRQLLFGVRLSHSGPRVSHLFFADDSLVFAKVSFDEAQVLMCILSALGRHRARKSIWLSLRYFLARMLVTNPNEPFLICWEWRLWKQMGSTWVCPPFLVYQKGKFLGISRQIFGNV